MITYKFAKEFTIEWLNSWNSHNLDKILSHYSDDFTIETPLALSLYPESKGVVRGKDEVRKYWAIGLERIPDLKFEVLDILIGIDNLTIYYLNTANNRRSVEIMSFNDDGKVYRALVNYSE